LKLVSSADMPLAKAPTANDPEKEFVEIPLNYSGSMADPLFLLVKQRGKKPSAEYANMVVIGFKVPDARGTVERAVKAMPHGAGFPRRANLDSSTPPRRLQSGSAPSTVVLKGVSAVTASR
jgi:hypothetical protein